MNILAVVEADVTSKIQFLLLLNLFLLVIGCMMDIFSATVVVVPLLLPLALRFGIDPVHLGIIFLANLEIGYMTPPVGINLFLASQRFREPMLSLFRAALPFLAVPVAEARHIPRCLRYAAVNHVTNACLNDAPPYGRCPCADDRRRASTKLPPSLRYLPR